MSSFIVSAANILPYKLRFKRSTGSHIFNIFVTPRQFLFLHSYSGPSDILFLVAMEVHRSFNQSTPSLAGSLLSIRVTHFVPSLNISIRLLT